jgi:hypothetical protein
LLQIAPQGLGFPAISKTATRPPFFNMVDRGLLDHDLFAIYINPNEGDEPAGELRIGGVNPSLFSGQIRPLPVVDQT